MRTSGRDGFGWRSALIAVGVVAGTVAVLGLLYLAAPAYLGGLADVFGLDARSTGGLSWTHVGLSAVFAVPLLVAMTVAIGTRFGTRAGGQRRRTRARWPLVLLVLAGAYTVLGAIGAVGFRWSRLSVHSLADRLGAGRGWAAEQLQQAAFPTLILAVYSLMFLRLTLRRDEPRRLARIYLAGAVLILSVVIVLAGSTLAR